jgi:hypothetical protein
LPPCAIDVDACPKFLRLLKQLKKKYRQIDADLKDLFEEVEKDYELAANAAAIPSWKGEVWKHRCASRDMQVGQSGGFRLISWVDKQEEPHVLYPLLIYPKSEKEDAAAIDIAEAMRLLKAELESRCAADDHSLGRESDDETSEAQ